MHTLLLQLAGPQQSWGTRSRFDQRDTGLEPSKSGVVGMLACALGRSRDQSVRDLAVLRMGVRIDRSGVLARDFHTAQNVIKADGSGLQDTAISERFYLADAAFLVGLEHRDRQLLDSLHAALLAPRWPLFLGRRSFVPSMPVVRPIENAVVAGELESALGVATPAIVDDRVDDRRRLVIESPGPTEHQRLDQPTGDFRTRAFAPRYVRMEVLDVSVQAEP